MTRTLLSDPLSARPHGPIFGPGARRGLGRLAFTTGLLALSLSLAGCGKAGHGDATPTGSFSDFAWGGSNATGDAPLPDAEPMLDTAPSDASRPLAGAGLAPVRYLPQYRDYPADDGGYVGNPDAGAYDMLALASTLGGVFGSAPPDYGFDYGGGHPWAWETGDRYVRYAEPIDQGYRYYYYGPDSDQPYLVRDPWYSYGYRDGRLMQIYGRDGRVIDARRALVQRRMADRYYARALAMRRAAESERHQGVSAQNWARHRAAIARAQDDWDRDSARRPGWEQWNDRHAPVVAARWTQERAVRRFAGDRFARWQQAGFRGKSPDFYREAADDTQLRREIHVRRQQAIRQEQVMQGVRRQRQQQRVIASEAQAQARQASAQRQQAVRAQREHQAQARQASAQRQQAVRAQRERQVQTRQASAQRQQAVRAQREHQAQARQASAQRQQAVRAQREHQAQARQASAQRQQAVRALREHQAQARQASAQRQQAVRAQRERQAQAHQVLAQRQQAVRAQRERQAQAHQVSAQRQQAVRAQRERQAQAHQASAQRQQATRAQQQQRQAQSRPRGSGHGGTREGHGGGHPGHP